MREQDVLKGSLCSLRSLYSSSPSLCKHYLWKAVGGEDVGMSEGKKMEVAECRLGGGLISRSA